jgi:hypothetical protein
LQDAIRPVLGDTHLGSDPMSIVMELEWRRAQEKTTGQDNG